MPESKGLELTISNLPEKYKDRILERRRTHGTRRTTFRDFKITLPPRPAEQPRTPEQILQRPENVFDNNFSKSVSSKRKSVHDDDDDEEYEQLGTPTPKMKNNDRSRSSQMSLGSPMEIDYSIDVGNIEVLISKGKYNDDEERSDIVIMDEVNILDKSPGKQLDTILDEVDIPEKFSEEQLDIFMGEGNEGNEVDDRDEEEVNVQDKSSEEQLDIDMDDVEVVKSSDEQEQVTEEKELSQNKRRSSRRKSKNEREIVNDKDKIPARSSKMHIDTEKDMEAKSSEEQIVETTEDTEKVIEISKGKKKPTSRHKNIVRRGVVKNKGKASAKSPEQINTVMNEVVPDKSSEEQEKATEINEEANEKNQNKRRSTRRKNIVRHDIVKNKDKISAKSPEQIDTVMDDVIPDKSSDEKEEEEEQNAGTAEEANEINQSRKGRRRNEVGREIVKNKGKTSAKSSKQIDITMDKVVPDKSSDDVTGISQNKKRPTRHKKVGRKTVKNKGKTTVKSPEISDTAMDEDIPEDASVILLEDQNVAEESINQPSEEVMDLEEAFEEQTAINQSRKKSSRLKIKCHKIGSSTIQDKDGNIVKKTSAAKLNELDIIGDAINDTIIEFLNDNNSFKKEIQYFKNEIELHLLEQSDLFDEQIMMRSSLRKSKTQMNCLRKEMLDVQRERDKVRKELANERRIFVNEEQERKKLEQAHNFLTDLETLREAVDAEDNMQEDQEDEGILDGFKGLLVSVTSRKGRFDALCRFNMLLEMCEKIVRQATDT
ncbi:unnamed protein product [Rhizophagus irregularis]|uniref:Uncharacterized protein n=1 Tax=Rhizophagus irregularis TaxID=588596 RepID=A0A2I1H1G9_9GLOM|nr:hypothetical protein RhiirA4_447359 [Rhizophagus irregularis]CAB4409273.1 unnamed protein product [Rhizophagus irregularis]